MALENNNPFGRGLRGMSYVYVTKDRPVFLRAFGTATKLPGKTYIGTLVGDDSNPFEPFALKFYAPKDDDTKQTTPLADKVRQVIDARPKNKVDSQRMLLAAMRASGEKFTDADVLAAVDDLIVSGRVKEITGARKSKGFQTIPTAADSASEK